MSDDTSDYNNQLKTQESVSSDDSSDSEDVVTVIEVDTIVNGLRKKAKVMNTDDLIATHFRKDFDTKIIKKWREDPSFWLPTTACPIPYKVPCAVCNRLAFSMQLRGVPIRPLEWFMDKDSDAYFLLLKAENKDVYNDLFKDLRAHEQSLRMIPRRKILECICDRFRGFKRQEKDKIDLLYSFYHFKSLEEWCRFKERFDKLVLRKIEEKNNKRSYCSGCGVKAEVFVSKRGDFYERCGERKCAFFHKLDTNFATVDRRN